MSTTDTATIDYATQVTSIDGQESTLEDYRGKLLLIVNTASECGFTPQFDGLEDLWQKYNDQDFAILGFPCNQFGGQDPGSNDEIATFCRKNYGVTFPMHQRIKVNGDDAHPLFKQLKQAAPGILNTKLIKWNFTKFLVGPDGQVIDRFGPRTTPEELDEVIARHLQPAA